MTAPTIATFVAAIQENELLRPPELDCLVHDLQGRFAKTRHLARELMNRTWLTSYQVRKLFQGKADNLRLGQYILLDRLGEGGMGQVFRARHRRLDRIDALKIIRPENLHSAQAVASFYREIRTAAQLSHPNVVHAYDADEVRGTHFFAMEYVDGPDLSRCVKQFGPVPVRTACDYIRQAALGLQHAYERGLVHRDIKPANLLVTHRGGVVKILDMGLARLSRPGAEDSVSSKTQEGLVVGTLDFLSPEQAMSAAQVDIRGDLYSLGCTFYFLLTGQVPFPGGSPVEKLARHRWAEPTPVEKLRPELDPAVTTMVRRLMAKEPGTRFQTPAELANQLMELSATGSLTSSVATGSVGRISTAVQRPPVTASVTTVLVQATEDTAEDWDAIIAAARDTDGASSISSVWQKRRRAEERRNEILLLAAVGIGLLLLICFLAFAWWIS